MCDYGTDLVHSIFMAANGRIEYRSCHYLLRSWCIIQRIGFTKVLIVDLNIGPDQIGQLGVYRKHLKTHLPMEMRNKSRDNYLRPRYRGTDGNENKKQQKLICQLERTKMDFVLFLCVFRTVIFVALDTCFINNLF